MGTAGRKTSRRRFCWRIAMTMICEGRVTPPVGRYFACFYLLCFRSASALSTFCIPFLQCWSCILGFPMWASGICDGKRCGLGIVGQRCSDCTILSRPNAHCAGLSFGTPENAAIFNISFLPALSLPPSILILSYPPGAHHAPILPIPLPPASTPRQNPKSTDAPWHLPRLRLKSPL